MLGGGYIAVELGYYFQSLGTDVTLVEMMDLLLPREDGEVANAFTEVAADCHEVYTGHRVTAVEEAAAGYTVRPETNDGHELAVEASEVLVGLGRRPNSDTLNLEAAGIETDDRDFIETNEYLETAAEGVWAQGDIAGNALFKHAGDYETRHHTIANVVRAGVDETGAFERVAVGGSSPPGRAAQPLRRRDTARTTTYSDRKRNVSERDVS